MVGAADQPAGGQGHSVDLVALGEDVEVADVDDLQRRLLAVEAALGQPHDEARAAAFPAGSLAEPGAALLALLTAAGGLAATAADAASEALAVALGAGRRLQIVELHFSSCPSISSR